MPVINDLVRVVATNGIAAMKLLCILIYTETAHMGPFLSSSECSSLSFFEHLLLLILDSPWCRSPSDASGLKYLDDSHDS